MITKIYETDDSRKAANMARGLGRSIFARVRGALLISGRQDGNGEAVIPMPHCAPHLAESIERYTEDRLETGGFLRAVLENDLTKAITYADADNIEELPCIVAYLVAFVPTRVWGSPEKVARHLSGARART